MTFLGLYRDPTVAQVTRCCDWRIADLVEGGPCTLYLVVPPSDISRTKPLVRLLLMLDEFPALGRLDFFESALAFMAGYGLKALFAQSLTSRDDVVERNLRHPGQDPVPGPIGKERPGCPP